MSNADKISITINTTTIGIALVIAALIAFILLVVVLTRRTGGNKASAVSVQTFSVPAFSEAEDENEIIAVIAAAVAAFGISSGKEYRIRQVRRASRSEWAMAGLLETTRPF